jgi:GNAT superfamily N-acetyltransferase
MLGVWSGARLVGFSTLAPWRRTRWDNGHESHVGLWDLHLHPACWRRDLCELLLEAVRSRAAEAGFRRLRAMETPEASPKTEILRAMGFRAGFTMPDALVFGEGIPIDGRYPSSRTEDLCAYELDLGRPGPFTHPYRVPWNE